MNIDPSVREHLDAGNLDAVEELWLRRLEDSHTDLDFFVPVLRTLVRRGEEERASLLADLLFEQHREKGDHDAEHRLLQRALQFWGGKQEIRRTLIENIRKRHAERPSLERLLQHFDLAAAADPLQTAASLETWLGFDIGSIVWMDARGLGRVADINLGLGSLRVEFAGKAESFRIGEAERLLLPLPPGHFLRDRVEKTDELRRLAETDPGGLLSRVFASLQRSLTTQDLRTYLAAVVPEEQWAAWWKRARGDRRLTVGSGSRPVLSWSESAADADAALAARFAAASLREQIDLARQHAGRSETLTRALIAGLGAATTAAAPRQAELALEAALLLDELESPHPALAGLLEAAMPEQIAAIPERRAREQALQRLRQTRADWPHQYAEMLRRETDSRTLAFVYDTLRQAQAAQLDEVIAGVIARPDRAPRFFVWLCRECGKRPDLRGRADWTLLRRMLDTLGDEACKSIRASVREMFDAGGPAFAIVETLTLPQAEQFLRMLDREGLEEHRKQPLRAIVWQRFPDLEPQADEEPLYVTASALESKRAEFERLVREEIPRNTEEIRKAAAHGDLRENFEYKAARERQEMLSSRAKSLHDELRRARALDPDHIDAREVRVGTRVDLTPVDGGKPRSMTILGPWDSEPAREVYSYLAPAVVPLLGKRPGERVEFAGQQYVVATIQVWKPSA